MTVGNTYKYIYKKIAKILRGHPYGGAEYRWGINFAIFLPISGCMWEMIQDRAIVTMER